MSLARFHDAQSSRFAGYAAAREELARGRKAGHWIWYIFPQLTGLGRSSTARAYGIADLAEAVCYLEDPVLRARLAEATALVRRHLENGMRLDALFGGDLDAMKCVSSLTLFDAAAEALARSDPTGPTPRFQEDCRAVLTLAQQQGFPRCRFTVAAIKAGSA